MKKILLILLLLASCGCYAQPNWFDADERAIRYPYNTYFIGFVQNNFNSKKQDMSIKEITDKANSALIESISVSIESNKELKQLENINENKSFIRSDYEIRIKSDAKNKLSGVKTEYYIDKSSNTIYGFVYVKKSDLCSFYTQELSTINSSALSCFDKIRNLEEQGFEYKIYSSLVATKEQFSQAGETKQMAVLTCPDELYKPILKTMANIADSTDKFLVAYGKSVRASISSQDDEISQMIRNAVTECFDENGCAITENKSQASLVVNVETSMKPHPQKESAFEYRYVVANISVVDVKKDVAVFSKEFSAKGGGIDEKAASIDACNKVKKEICESLYKELFN